MDSRVVSARTSRAQVCSCVVLSCLLAITFQVFVFSPISPDILELPPTSSASLVPTNSRLQRVIKLGEGFLENPEDVCVDKSGILYTATRDGWIRRLHRNGSWENWRKIDSNALLGITTTKAGSLIVCDGEKGLFKVDEDGVTVLTSHVKGTEIRLADDVIEASDGSLYFSVASTKFGFLNWHLDLLEAKPNGQLLKYDPSSNDTSVVIDGLYFANGVALSAEQDYLVVCETWKYRCLKYWLSGEDKGKTQIFVDNLPGAPDNINLAPDGSYWIALLQLFSSKFEFVHTSKAFRHLAATYPGLYELAKSTDKKALVVNVAADGKIIRSFDDPTGEVMSFVTRGGFRKCGGWVGYFSYDTVRYVEKKKLPFSSAPQDERNLHDIHLGLYDDIIVFDQVEKKAYVIHWVRLDQYSSIEKAYDDGMKRLEMLASKVLDIEPPRLSPGSVDFDTGQFGPSLEKSTMTSEEYKNIVLQAKEHILAGDIFQIVLSQRFERRTFADPFEIYRALRVVNPSPYMTYLQARGCILVASSPEILTRIEKKKIVNRPLAGTSRRGKTSDEDEMLEMQLLEGEKQCAEHIMLVDLGRNDVGKVSKSGSVKVEKLKTVERYSHVMHISSTVTGELDDHLTCWDALSAALPVGTVSGAPKVKAMELIDELEVTRRGPYGGGFGSISFTSDMNIALALRSIIFPTRTRYDTLYSYKNGNNRREWVAHLQTGAGIVTDSNPDDEQRECENKAAGLARAIELAESTFVDN